MNNNNNSSSNNSLLTFTTPQTLTLSPYLDTTMPSQPPPPLSTSKMSNERDMDSIGPSAPQDWNMTTSTNGGGPISTTLNTSNTTTTHSSATTNASSTRSLRRSSSTSTASPTSSLASHSSSIVALSSPFSTSSLQEVGASVGGLESSSFRPPVLQTSTTSRSLEPIERRHATLTNLDTRPSTIDRLVYIDPSSLSHQQMSSAAPTQMHQLLYNHSQQHTHAAAPRPTPVIDNSLLKSPETRLRQRTHSSQSRSKLHTPSVQLALADPALSKSLSSSPVPSRSGSEQNQQAQAKQSLERNVRRYYYQLTVGCQLPSCTNKLCRSCKLAPKMTKDAAAILSIQLATRPRLFFCPNCPEDPNIQVPDSPIPATPLANGRPPSLQISRGLSTTTTTTTRVLNTTLSSASLPDPAASLEDFSHSKSRLLYDPNEYSKSVPSFPAARLLSPSAGSRRQVTSYDQETFDREIHPSTTTPLSPGEQGGTPLFRSLLSLSPFSRMFTSGTRMVSKSQEITRKRLSPTHQFRKSHSTGGIPDNGRPNNNRVTAPVVPGLSRNLGGDHSYVHVRTFSPTRSTSPPGSPITPPASLPDTCRTDASSRMDSPFGYFGHHSSGWMTHPGEETVGLGYTSGIVNSQRVLDLSRYYNARTTASRKSRKQRRNVGHGRDRSPTSRPMFGSFHDPDSDSTSTSSSVEDEPIKTGESSWRGSSLHSHQHSFSHQHRNYNSGSAVLSTVSPPQSPLEKELESRTLYSFTRTCLRRDSTSSISSEGEAVTPGLPWSSIAPFPSTISARRSSSTSSLASTSSSRRSSMGESEVLEVALPYLNLTLLRQAIETYNASKPECSPQSPPSLTLKDFKTIHPATWAIPLDYQDDQRNESLEIIDQRTELIDNTDSYGSIPIFHSNLMCMDTSDRDLEFPEDGSVPLGVVSGLDKDKKEMTIQTATDSITSMQDVLSSNHRTTNSIRESERALSDIASPTRSTISSRLCASEGDSTFLLDSLKSVFSSATALGSSFLMKDREDRSSLGIEFSDGVSVGGIDLEALRECYEMMIELKPRTIFAIQVTNSIEILLARMELEMEMDHNVTGRRKVWSDEEMRAIFILLMNPFLFEQPYQETLLRRILLIFIAFPDKTKLIQWLSCMDDEGMAQLVTLFKMYLSAHFTPRPMGESHPAICAVKSLSILYQANNLGSKREQERRRRAAIQDAKDGRVQTGAESNSTISFKYFYSGVMEALKFKDEYQIWRDGWDKSLEEKQFSYFDYPFLLSPTSKSHIMNLDALTQMSAHYEDACVRHALADHAQRLLPESMTASAREFQKGIRAASSPYLVLELTRGHLVEEAFEQITKKHADLKKPLKVAFVDVGEEGMDQGGVTKEFFQIMVEKVFDSQFGLFKEMEEGHSWWFEGIMDGSSHIEISPKDIRVRLIEYELVGILVGLALYNGVILGVRFPSVVYRKLLGWEIGLDSFIESFPALGNGLEQMLTWTDGDVYDVFMREFEISYEYLGQVTTLPLMPNGQNIPVTNGNREQYVKAYIDHYVHVHIQQEFTAFQRGFEKICGGEALKLLRPEELELLLCGNADLDMHDLEASCLYDDGYSRHHTLIKEFWEIVHDDLSPEQHKQLLVFVTGSDRVPIRGLKDLMFVIQRNGPDSDRLPTALTCFSRLLLPEYASKSKMKERLVTAIENSNGFGLV